MPNQERKNELEIKIKEKEDELKHCSNLADELELLIEIDDLYSELYDEEFLGNE